MFSFITVRILIDGAHKGLSIRSTHVNGRTRCLNEFTKYYKDQRLPIHYTNVLFVHEPQSYYPKEKLHIS